MKNSLKRLGSALFCSLLFMCMPTMSASNSAPIRVACAANARTVIEQLARSFETEHGIKVDVITASSGKLSAQIQAGAPFDVFVSADEHYPALLYSQKHGKFPPKVYAIGRLALWSPTHSIPVEWPHWLSQQQGKIAIANPDTAPYGAQAIHALRYYKIYDEIKHRLVMGESVGQVNQFMRSGTVPFAITAFSALDEKVRSEKTHVLLLSEGSHSPIRQSALLLNADSPQAALFYQALFSAAHQAQFTAHGYQVP